MSSFAQGFAFGFCRPRFCSFGGFGFGWGYNSFGFNSFGFNRGRDPISTCYADLDSRSGLSSWMPGLNYTLNQGCSLPLQTNSRFGLFSMWC